MGNQQKARGTGVFTCLALVAFAANSILTRVALEGNTIDAASFATVRLASGTLALFLILAFSGGWRGTSRSGDWIAGAMLFLYAAPFSFAYLSLSTGTGALILFGSVQATMLLAALLSGERPRPAEWTGLALALGGLLYLVFPGLDAPEPGAASLMALAGMAWGVYSLRGRRSADPLAGTAHNFVRAVPLAGALSLLTVTGMRLSGTGILLAVGSGALASGLGYAVWYRALGGLSATRASLVQLSVPVLAGLGGVLFLAETLSPRLILSAAIILGGVGLAVGARGREPAPPSDRA